MSTEREAMTLEQVRELAATGAACSSRSSLVPERWADIRDAIDVHLAREKAESVATVCLVGDRYALGSLVEVQLQLASKDAPNPKIGDRYYTHPTASAEASVAKAEIQKVIAQMTSQQWGGFESIPLRAICEWRDRLSRAIGEVPFDGIARDAGQAKPTAPAEADERPLE